jgi:hypothetical protein
MSPPGLLRVDGDVFRKYSGQPLKLSADVDFIVSKFVIVGELPLVKGARFDHGSEHAVVTDVLRQGDGVEIVVQDRRVQLLFYGESGPPAVNGTLVNQGQPGDIYLLRNSKRNEAIFTEPNTGSNNIGVNDKILVKQTMRFSFGPRRGSLMPELNDAWLAGARLVRLHLTPVGRFSRKLVADDFRLQGPNRAAIQPRPAAANSASLARIPLPENPTKAQARDYVKAILIASQRRNSYSPDDPQVGMLAKVGPQNLDVLFEFKANKGSGPGAFYLGNAIARLARPEDKEFVLRALPTVHELITLVVKSGWQAEARDTLVAALRDEQEEFLSREWIQAVASFEEPDTYPELKSYLMRCSNKQMTYMLIRRLPGIDLEDTVASAWKDARRSSSAYTVLDSCMMAAEYGHADVLESLVDILKRGDDENFQRRAATFIRRYTPATGNNDALIAWYEANRDRLVFDPKLKKFMPGPMPSSTRPSGAQAAPANTAP